MITDQGALMAAHDVGEEFFGVRTTPLRRSRRRGHRSRSHDRAGKPDQGAEVDVAAFTLLDTDDIAHLV